MKLKQFVIVLVFFILIVLGYLGWSVRKKGEAARVPDLDTSWLQQPVGDDMQMRMRFHDELQAYLEKEDFNSLDRIADEITKQKTRFAGGDWKLLRFFEAVAYPPHGFVHEQVDWPKRFAAINKWIDQTPFIYAAIALAQAHLGHESYAEEGLSRSAGPREGSEVAQAREALESVADRKETCVEWYTTMLNILQEEEADQSELRKAFEEGLKVEPLYSDLYVTYARYMLGHGKSGDWEEFAVKSAKSIGGSEGDILYAEICWQLSRNYGNYGNYYRYAKVSYPEIRKGFVERMKRYGPSYRYMNAFCLLAGSAADRPTVRALMEKIGDHWEPDFWEDKKHFDDYRNWAFQ